MGVLAVEDGDLVQGRLGMEWEAGAGFRSPHLHKGRSTAFPGRWARQALCKL